MQAVAAVSEILHEAERKTFITDEQIAFRRIRKNYIVAMQICQSRIPVHIDRLISVRSKGNRKGEVGIRNKRLSLELTHRTSRCEDMKLLLQRRHV